AWFPIHPPTLAKFGGLERKSTPWTRPENFVGNGPYALKEWRPNQVIVAVRSPTYWDRDRVRLNAVHFYPTDSIDSEERAFRAGQLHATWNVPLSKVLPLQREKSPSLRIDANLETFFFRLNVRKAPLTDERVRRALSLAIDHDTIANKILPGGRQPAPTFISPLLVGYTPPTRKAYDVEAAKKLLAEAGFADGKGLPPIEILYNNSEILRMVAEAIQQMWRNNLGVDIRLVNQEYKVVFANRRAGDYQILLGSWTADYLDATTFLDMWLSDSGNNHTGWKSPAYDALAARALTIADPNARAAVLAEAETLVLDAALP
ncbi:MAG: peptide ABC transporter substrate-binding protein, partial [Verrucomicrobia bacterium]|nr:peptide ABC transporter substrate-binding protein [Verrucomicrobiota bacterium]